MIKKLGICYIFVFLVSVILIKSTYAENINIACAANFYTTLEQVTKIYQKQHPDIHFTIMQGASSKLATQIENGMPVDLFLSADETYAQKLVKAGKADKAYLYAIGEVVLITHGSSRFASALNYLEKAPIAHMSISNPNLSPYGWQSVKILKDMGLWTNISSKVIYGEDIGQTFSYFVSNNVNVAFVALSQVRLYEQEDGSHAVQVYYLNDPNRFIKQDAVIIKGSQQADAAKSFLIFLLQSPKANKVLKSMGYHI